MKRDIGKEILEGVRELKEGRTGRTATLPPIARTRAALALSQAEFARLLGVSVRTLQEWEQGRRAPSGAARTLILIANRNPKALLDVAVLERPRKLDDEFAGQRKMLAAAFLGWSTDEVGSLVENAVAAARRKPGKR